MIEDPSFRIKETSAAAVQSILSLSHHLCMLTTLEPSQYSIFLKQLMDHLKTVGGG